MSPMIEIYNKIFSDEYPALKEMLERFGSLKRFKTGEFIIQEDNKAEGFYWILSGGAKVFVHLSNKAEQIITVLSEGDFIGIAAVMNDHLYRKNAVVVSADCEVMYIPKDDFFAWMETNPIVALPILRQIESKIDRIENRATFIMRKSIEQRLAYVFLMLFKKFGNDEKGFLKFQLSPKDLANFIGTTRTTVYRVLKKFQEAHILNTHHKKIQLLSIAELEGLYKNTAA